MRPSELAQVLRGANPWWSRHHRVTWVVDDPELSQREHHELVPATRDARTALAEVGPNLRPGTATVLVGPRGVGKTTAAKDAVLRVLSNLTVDPRAILWVPVEPGPDNPEREPLEPSDLEAVLRRPTRVGAPACDGPRLIVIDEASASEDWVDAVSGGATNAQVFSAGPSSTIKSQWTPSGLSCCSTTKRDIMLESRLQPVKRRTKEHEGTKTA
jgi:hypothetical protein